MTDCRYIVRRGNLQDVRKQLRSYLCDLDDRVQQLEDSSAQYKFDDTNTTTPAQGYCSWNNADPTLVTDIYCHDTTSTGLDISAFLTALAIQDRITILDNTTGASYVFELTGDSIGPVGDVYTLPVTLVSASVPADPAQDNDVTLIVRSVGPHLLYGPEHTDVDITKEPVTVRDLLSIPSTGTGLWTPETRMNWRNAWSVGVNYYTHDVVYDEGYGMVANKTTTDKAAPQRIGDPDYMLPENPAWSNLSEVARVSSGHLYTFTAPTETTAIRVWVPSIGPTTNYILTIIINGAASQTKLVDLSPGWNVVGVSPLLFPVGGQLLAYLEALNTGSSTTVAGGWTYSGTNNADEPPSQSWNTNQQQTLLRVDFEDLDSVARQTELEGIIVGSTIQFVETGNPDNSITFRVVEAPVTAVTSVNYTVVVIDTGIGQPTPGQPTTMTADVPVAQSTDYVGIVGGWLGNQPNYATVQSFLQFDGADQGADPDNQYGIDLAAVQLSVSPDWDFLSIPGGSGGGGGDFTPEIFAGTGTTGYVPDPVAGGSQYLDADANWGPIEYGDLINTPVIPPGPPYDHTTELTNVGTNTHLEIDSHIADLNNPHQVTYAQLPDKPTIPGSYWTLNGDDIYNNNSGNVGIGLTTPVSALDIGFVTGAAGGLHVAAYNAGTQSDIALAGNAVVGAENSLSMTAQGSAYFRWMTGATGYKGGTAGSTERMRITSAGNVGIGKTAPTSILHLNGAAPSLTIQDTSTSITTAKPKIRLAESGASNSVDNYWDIGTNLDDAAFSLQIGANGADPSMTFSRTAATVGNVGIGKTTPEHRLHVSDPAKSEILIQTELNDEAAEARLLFKTRVGASAAPKSAFIAEGTGGSWGLHNVHLAVRNASDSTEVSITQDARQSWMRTGQMIFYGVNKVQRMEIASTGELTVDDLATGGANEMVVADTAGKLSTQPIPDSVLQGSWTPTFVRADNGANLGSPTYGSTNGRYWTLGDLCFITGYIEVNAGSTDTTVPMAIGGLPFACNGNRNGGATVTSSGYLGAFGAEDFISIGLVSLAGQTRMALRVVYAAASTAYQPELGMSASFFNSGTTNRARIYFTGQYRFNS